MISTPTLLRAALCVLMGTLAACDDSELSSPSGTAGSTASVNPTKAASAVIALSSSAFTAAPASSALVTIARSSISSGAASVGYTTVNGTAASGVDYTPTSGTLSWTDGDNESKTISVPVSKAASGLEFHVVLTSVSGSASLGSPSTATVTVAGAAASSSSSGGSNSSGSSSSSSGGGSSGSSSGAKAPPAAVSGDFGVMVKGDKLVSTKDGSTIEVIGTNISGLETGMNWRWPSFANAGEGFWSKVINWGGSGINTVRLPLNEASWLNYTCVDPGAGASGSFYTSNGNGTYTPDPDGTYQATVKKAVGDATAAGLYVILDLHWGSPNNSSGKALCPIGQPAYADYDHSLTFWKQVADAFKGNPAVMFELFNEPFGSNDYGNWVTGASGAGPDAITLRDGGSFLPLHGPEQRQQQQAHDVFDELACSRHAGSDQYDPRRRCQ